MQIQEIIDLMNQMSRTGLNLLEFESAGERLRLERPADAPAAAETGSGLNHAAASKDGAEYENYSESAEKDREPAAKPDEGLVKSPVVGIFYAASTPDCEPFVKIGSRVESGDTLCIIEAMKLMNEVTSPHAGEILEIFVVNGQRIEYGQPLMRIGVL
ncbi:MAG: acetyl-CoA carboxylase biotin carboxyl carrier protein [Clostridiaceae bacterium]|nr:acetyl-CoA carboxylase biotin carboxyl carrier protein [Clostridiaceae bacterium]